MHTRPFLYLVLASALLAGCGSDHPDTASAGHPAPAKTKAAANTSGDASAMEVAAAARGDVHCPADTGPARAEGAPVDDIVGVRPGMSYEQAANAVLCSHPLLVVSAANGRGFDIKTYGQTIRQGFEARFAEPRVQKTGRQIVQEMERNAINRTMNVARQDMQPGQSRWFVGTMGMPGEEKVISAARDQWFDEGRNPTIDSVAQALTAKYGPPTQRIDNNSTHWLRWASDPRGRPIGEASPLYQKCDGASSPNDGMSVSPDCGVVVAARIVPLRDNPALAQHLEVGVVNQAAGYQALTDTEQGLQAQDAARRAQQVRDASQNAQAPQL